jgi:anaphase-promoting complex subunit 6
LAITLFKVGPVLNPPPLRSFDLQALSINPINAHVLELLNLALEASAESGPLPQFENAGQSEEWAGKMRAQAAREAQIRAARDKEKEKEGESSTRAAFGDMQEGEAGMTLG